jgi:hypothetical protein
MIKKVNLYLLTALILIASSVFLYSANEKFTTSVNRNSVGVGEQIQVSYSLENAQGNNFKPPTFKGFSVLAGPSSSNYTQIINGKVSSSMGYTFILRAENEGTYTIAGADITVNGTKLHSNSVSISVTKAKQNLQSPGSQSKNNNQSNQSGKQDNGKSLDAQANEIISKNMFIKLNVNKSTCYKGEPIFAIYKLYINPELSLLNISSPKMPVFNGFWSQEIDIKAIEFSGTEVINGIKYKTAELKKVVLIPQQTGELTVDGFDLDSRVRLKVQGQSRNNSRDPFDDFFDNPFASNYRDFNYVIKSQTAKVNVKPLPANAPMQFNGAVGNYKFEVSLDKNKVIQNEPVSLKVKISGSGNLKLVQTPDLNLPLDIEKFDPKINDNISISSAGLSGEKTFEYILIVRNPGQFKIPALTFVYFDYNKGQYVSITSKELLLEVEKGNYQDYASSSVNKQDVQYLGKDIRFIKDDANLKPIGYTFIKSALFYLFSALPIICFIIFLLFKRRKNEHRENEQLYKSKYANKTAIKALSFAKNKFNNGDMEAVYQEVHTAMLNYFAHKFTMSTADLSKDNISLVLSSKNYSINLIQEVNDILQLCEMARYAPIAEPENANNLINQAEIAITSMEGK